MVEAQRQSQVDSLAGIPRLAGSLLPVRMQLEARGYAKGSRRIIPGTRIRRYRLLLRRGVPVSGGPRSQNRSSGHEHLIIVLTE